MENLKGMKIAIVIENQFIPIEIKTYKEIFGGQYEASLHFASRLWGQNEQTFIQTIDKSDFDDPQIGNIRINQIETIQAEYDVTQIVPSDYAAVIMAANYTSVRCRYYDANWGETPQTTPVVNFWAEAMKNKSIIKGFLCHALWILTPIKEVLCGRHVVCHEVVRSDIENAGGIYTESSTGVCIDDDIVTGKSACHVVPFTHAIINSILQRKLGQ